MNYWLALHSIGIGTATFNNLLEKFSEPEKIFKATRNELLAIPRISSDIINSILAQDIDKSELKMVEKELKNRGFNMITIYDKDYPPLLKKGLKPPPIIYIYGKLNTAKNIAIVGARSASSKGLNVAYKFAKSLAKQGFTIVSGYAKGIDTYAHLGAIAGNSKTIMVLPTGVLNFVVHKEFSNIRENLFANGTIISQFYPLAGWSTWQAMVRNRMISELSKAVFVAEAGIKRGTISTAMWAKKLNKPVFIYRHNLPDGSQVLDGRSKEILELGAIPVETPEEIIDFLK